MIKKSHIAVIIVAAFVFAAVFATNKSTASTEEAETVEETDSITEFYLATQQEVCTTESPTEELKEAEETAQVLSYTEDDLFCLAAATCREAGGQSEEIQLLVANVIINRVESPIYPDSIRKVLTQYKQYGMMWKNGVSFPNWADENVKSRCYKVAERILNGERFCPDNVLYQAEFKQGSGVYKKFVEGKSIFYFCYY